ncbi:class A beta-lactamase-related serine hydrolase [Aquimarina sp. BL5]|uniref:serine hydrolase domain-containing protein n=1 Tax=Aquimarina sp. BL5 TaxID=1714860 RepID=UPI000E51C101|nr:serine hydrolase domain-containing protein [Aquimarina sp. BL5]AXT52143.1 class A beta-lactamase-related serine hydrolase [Aquimarina sp. BL5]RKN10799.1 class A beta-lactamase-related serine hydrolase [Aquimarina sp. BL5]
MVFTKQVISSVLITFSSFISFSQDNFDKEKDINALMNECLVDKGKKPVHNFLLYAENAETEFQINTGVGEVKRKSRYVNETYQFNIASITKTLVATIILQMEEEGKLKIEDKAEKYLGTLEFIDFKNLHILNKTSYSDDIDIKMLLNHTSGIADVFIDKAIRFNLSVLLNPKKQYTAKKFFEKYYKYGLNKKPHNAPGKGYYYSDINYMLLGFIIEELSGETLAQVIRKRILEPLQMQNTYFEFYEPIKGNGKRIDAFLNRINITKKVNTSYEWAGGGLVSTTEDMANFVKALFKLRLFKHKQALNKMIDCSDTEKFNKNYGLGIFKYEIKGITFYGHGGFYGSFLAYAPKEGLLISANVNQANPPFNSMEVISKLVSILHKNQI